MASNNFFLNNDPLLFNNPVDNRQSIIDLERYRQQQNQYDYLSELDKLTRENANVREQLNQDNEYMALSQELQTIIQNELMSQVRWRINTNPNAVKNMQRQMDIIKRVKTCQDEEQRKNLDEINDYIKNHSNITFDEYRKAKQDNKEQKKRDK